MERIALNEGWRIGWVPFTGRWNVFGGLQYEMPELDDTCVWDATVPGVVQMDLERHGIIPDLFVGMNADHGLWIEDADWWYVLDFDGPAFAQDQHVRLLFHGLDTFATVWLNDVEVGQSANMFVSHGFDVTTAIKPDVRNRLVIRLAAPRYSAALDQTHGPLPCSPERLFVRKAQMSYGWDIAPRIVTVGIWRPVELQIIDAVSIENVWIRAGDIEEDGTVRCQIDVELEWHDDEAGTAIVRGTVYGVPFLVEQRCERGANVFRTELLIEHAPLWWPVGYGEAQQVDARVTALVDDHVWDAWEGPVALCRVALVETPQPSGAQSFRFRVNNRDVFITGFNYTPLDALFPRVSETRITEVLERMRDVGCNMLRVWGGGTYESPHFYQECQRLGILVWQDFMLSCGYYPQDDGFAEILRDEATQVVKSLRGYGCLAIWCGDNEGDMFYGRRDWYHNRPLRETFPEVLSELDPDRAYIPSSPYTPGDTITGDKEKGDTHCWAHGVAYNSEGLMGLRCRFLSEFGRLALPSMACIEQYIPEDERWPLTNWMWRYHAADSHRRRYPRGAEKILEEIDALGLPSPANLQEAIELSQQIQADALCAWIESYCEDPEFGGFLIWNVGDCWPQQSDSVLDYLGEEKAVVPRLKTLFARCQAEFQAPTK